MVGDQIVDLDAEGSQLQHVKPHVYTSELVTDDPLNYRAHKTKYQHSFLEPHKFKHHREYSPEQRKNAEERAGYKRQDQFRSANRQVKPETEKGREEEDQRPADLVR